ncbi:hypothetical protein GS896_25280 [Rhodococcus hoagii]|nr:hypothetical protein [Prescottella equi]NKR23454.1 hypothetical protein [Prescottella equi]NKT55934.1 hypothetical protein [Prescottella equi]NKU37447.1 hypothetical protein [Prescottella equi]NKZ79686.1 hypothetical protein [Prescottella equi]
MSDDERRAIDMRRLDEVLDAFVDTPLDQLDNEKLLADLDRALTPGNMRRPIDVPDEPVVPQPSKREAHHEIGDATDDDYDEHVGLHPGGGGSTDVEVGASSEVSTLDGPTAAHLSSDPIDGLFDLEEEDTDNPDGEESAHTSSSASSTLAHDDDSTNEAAAPSQYDGYRSTPSADPGLNLSSGLRDLLSRRTQGPSSTQASDVYGGAPNPRDASGEFASYTDPIPPVAAEERESASGAPAPSPEFLDSAETAVLPRVDVEPGPQSDVPPIPMRQDRDAKPSAIGSVRAEMGSRLGALDPGRRKALKVIAGFAVVGLVLMVVQSCLPDDSNQQPVASPAPSSAQQPSQPSGSAEIPVPDRSEGSLAPTAVSARCPDGSTDARLALTADKAQAWICKRALGIDGAVMEMTFPKPVVVTDVFMVPGFDYVEPSGVDRWVEHRVVTRAQWTIGDQRFIQEINPSRAGANMTIPSVETQKITVTIMETAEPPGGGNGRGFGFAGKKDDSFAVSLIRITGHQP